MTSDKLNSIKRKIAALLAKANSTDNEHEAAAFIAKANEMLEAHQLEGWDPNDVAASTAADPVNREMMFSWKDATPSLNDHKLFSALARFYGCRVIQQHGRAMNAKKTRFVNTTELHVFGAESARETLKLMFPFVMDQCKAAGKRLNAQGHGSPSKMALRVVNALLFRVHRLTEEAKVTVKAPVAQSRALVIVNQVDAMVDASYSNLKTTKARAITTTQAATAEAAKVSLNRQVRGDGTKLIK
jgi:hypothetical protein